MKELEDLKQMYKDEIKRVTKKESLTPADDEAAKKAMEGLEKAEHLCETMKLKEEAEFSQRAYGMGGPVTYQSGYSQHDYIPNRMPEMSYGYPYYGDGYSERRGRNMRNGQYISRNDYSTHDDASRYTLEKLEDMRTEAPDERTRRAIDMAIDELRRR